MAELTNGALLKEVYDKVSSIHGDIKVIKEQIEGRNGLIEQGVKHGSQIEKLYEFKWKIVGGVIVISFLFSLVARAFLK